MSKLSFIYLENKINSKIKYSIIDPNESLR